MREKRFTDGWVIAVREEKHAMLGQRRVQVVHCAAHYVGACRGGSCIVTTVGVLVANASVH